MCRRRATEADLGSLAHRLPAAHRRVAGHDVLEQVVWDIEVPAHGGFVHLDHAARLPPRAHFRRWGWNDLRVAVDVFEPENEIVSRECGAVRPLHAFPQEQSVALAVVAERIALGDTGYDLAAV